METITLTEFCRRLSTQLDHVELISAFFSSERETPKRTFDEWRGRFEAYRKRPISNHR